jgi:Ca2+-transporting ATPase
VTEPLWAVDVPRALELAASRASGLSASEADQRRAQHGPNRLPEAPPRSRWALALAQLRGGLNLVLVAAAILAAIVSDVGDAILIGAVVVLNSALGFYQEQRAEQSLRALRALSAPRARVRRGGAEDVVQAAELLVPGDVVLVEAGDRVPADGRLVEAHALEVDESALTGESLPVDKRARGTVFAEAPVAQRSNYLFMNTVVTRGRGALLVAATGARTEMGHVAGMLRDTSPPATPLQRQLDQLGKHLAAIAAIAVVVITGVDMLRGQTLAENVLEAITLFVAAIPEGLPAVVTVTLALGVHRMARQRAIVKRLGAVETLGCTTVICTDKTGTLTVNQMTARAFTTGGRSYAVSGEGYGPAGSIARDDGGAPVKAELEPLALACALCNDASLRGGRPVGDPTELALLVLAGKAGLDLEAARGRFPRLAEIPFESERRFMATVHGDGDRARVVVKGAPDVVLGRCTAIRRDEGDEPLSEPSRAELARRVDEMAARGLRVLALAARTVPERALHASEDLEARARDLTLLGLVGLVDPPRAAARDAIAHCQTAGITVKMITGDHRATAGAIAADLGLPGDAVDGAALDVMSDTDLAARVETIGVFARVTPEHKLRLVRALRARGHVVAMTGDGVNDAPALKSADIGVAMGSGTEVAKEAATMVLTDDDFATIVGAVREGRTIYDNILKFVRFQVSTNMGALLTVFMAPLLGLPTPLKPVHVLFVAMFADGPPAITLGLEPPRPSIMRDPPRDPRARMLTAPRLGVLVFHGAVMTAGTLALLGWKGVGADHAATLAFTTFVLFQLFNLLNVRTEPRSVFSRQTFTNARLWLALVVVAGLQVAIVTWGPLRRLFDTVPLSASEWGLAAAFASSLVAIEELRKLGARALARRRSSAGHAKRRPVPA